ncbi:MAG: ornithine cyclodeaminase family protein [Roseivirga sp.]|nr:ornithine cyclodeaminase family protein [Roseivirga sp.]
MRIIDIIQIREIIAGSSNEDLLQCIEEAFISLSDGSANVPPVGHLGFTAPPGDMHIKYGYIQSDPYYVVKIASGFYQNQSLGLPNNNGMMLVFNAKTGLPECLLQDEGYLTDLRTALAGAVAAKHIGPENVKSIGIIGTGIQARMQLEMLSWITDCKEVYVYGRSTAKSGQYQEDMNKLGFNVSVCTSPAEVAAHCNLIVTTTASQQPLLFASDIRPGTHITAMGADAPGKQELDAVILAKANLVACDSKAQCLHQGESHLAVSKGLVKEDELKEIGSLLKTPVQRKEDDITVADLTGIATQDIKISSYILQNTIP